MTNPKHYAPRHSQKAPNLASSTSRSPLHSPGFASRHRLRAAISLGFVAVLLFALTFVCATWLDFSNALRSSSADFVGEKTSDVYIDPDAGKPINIAIFGQDTRNGGENSAIAHDTMSDEHESDTIMIAQISSNRRYINLVSVPRDSIVSVPQCITDNGKTVPAQQDVMINSLFELSYNVGGDAASAASCATQDLEYLTGIKITQFIVVDFAGLDSIINAIGGVDICVPEHIQDAYTSLNLPKGWDHLNGLQATEYSRVRHGIGVGDGSDIMREARQQYLVKMILRQIEEKGILTNSGELYQLAETTLHWLTLSKGLTDPATLVGLAYVLRNLNTSDIYARTTPVETDPQNPDRVIWAQPYASELWTRIKDDKPIVADTNPSKTLAQEKKGTGTSESVPPVDTAAGTSASPSTGSAAKPDLAKGIYNPSTGLVTMPSGELIDPKNYGIVNPVTGVITDPDTGYQMGIASEYLNQVVCGVSEEK